MLSVHLSRILCHARCTASSARSTASPGRFSIALFVDVVICEVWAKFCGKNFTYQRIRVVTKAPIWNPTGFNYRLTFTEQSSTHDTMRTGLTRANLPLEFTSTYCRSFAGGGLRAKSKKRFHFSSMYRPQTYTSVALCDVSTILEKTPQRPTETR